MSPIQEIFLETDWDDADQARAARDQRAAQLQAEGHICSCTTLYRATDGRCVFVVEVQPPESSRSEHPSSRRKPVSRRPPTKPRDLGQVEYR